MCWSDDSLLSDIFSNLMVSAAIYTLIYDKKKQNKKKPIRLKIHKKPSIFENRPCYHRKISFVIWNNKLEVVILW